MRLASSAQRLKATSVHDAVALRSRGLELVLSRIEFARWREAAEDDVAVSAPGKAMLLELGAPLAANVAYLNRFRCRLYVADAYRGLCDLALEDAVAETQRILPLADEARLDAVFAWDIMSYLDPLVITALATAVARHCSSGTLLHALSYTGAQIPAEPGNLCMVGDSGLDCKATTTPVRANPNHSPVALERMLPGFQLRHSFLLSGGLQDFLFAFE